MQNSDRTRNDLSRLGIPIAGSLAGLPTRSGRRGRWINSQSPAQIPRGPTTRQNLHAATPTNLPLRRRRIQPTPTTRNQPATGSPTSVPRIAVTANQVSPNTSGSGANTEAWSVLRRFRAPVPWDRGTDSVIMRLNGRDGCMIVPKTFSAEGDFSSLVLASECRVSLFRRPRQPLY